MSKKKRFLIDLRENNVAESLNFSPRRKYSVTNLKMNANIKTDITKWNNYNKIRKLSNFC